MDKLSKASYMTNILSGLSLAPLVLVDSLGKGLLVFSPLGTEYLPYGIYVGLTGSFVSMLFIALFRSKVPLISYPSTMTSIILLGFVSGIMSQADYGELHIHHVVVMVMMVMFFSALFQVLFAYTGLTRKICHLKRGLLVGMLNGMGIIVIVSQIPTLLGIPLKSITSVDYVIEYAQPWTLAVGIITLLALFSAEHWVKRYRYMPPVLILGMCFGIGSYYYIEFAALYPELGPRIGTFNYSFEMLYQYTAIFQHIELSVLMPYVPLMLLTALSTAVFATIQNYMSMAKQMPYVTTEAFNHESLRQGFSNLVTALTGGINGAASIGATEMNRVNGGRTRLVNYTCAVSIVMALMFFQDIIASVPYIVIGAVFMYVGMTYLNRESFHLYREMLLLKSLSAEKRLHGTLSLVTMILVISTALPIAIILSVLMSYVIYHPSVVTWLSPNKSSPLIPTK